MHRSDVPYSLAFQVWRPSPTVNRSTGTGCYSLVGDNRFISASLSDGILKVTPSPRDYIMFQPRDVLGFYIRSVSIRSPDEIPNGLVIQTSPKRFTSELVWYTSISSYIRMLTVDDCPCSVGHKGILVSSTQAAPVISVGMSKYMYTCSTNTRWKISVISLSLSLSFIHTITTLATYPCRPSTSQQTSSPSATSFMPSSIRNHKPTSTITTSPSATSLMPSSIQTHQPTSTVTMSHIIHPSSSQSIAIKETPTQSMAIATGLMYASMSPTPFVEETTTRHLSATLSTNSTPPPRVGQQVSRLLIAGCVSAVAIIILSSLTVVTVVCCFKRRRYPKDDQVVTKIADEHHYDCVMPAHRASEHESRSNHQSKFAKECDPIDMKMNAAYATTSELHSVEINENVAYNVYARIMTTTDSQIYENYCY